MSSEKCDLTNGNDFGEGLESKNEMEETLYKPCEKSDTKLRILRPVNQKSKESDSWFLYFTSFTGPILYIIFSVVVGLSVFSAGIGFSWTSPVLPKLMHPNNPLGGPITPFQESWIATSLSVGAMVGPLAIGNIADIFGRKKSLLILSTPMLLSYLILAFATGINYYYIARFMHGFSVGAIMAILTMYMGEITENHNRGKFNCMLGIFVSLGLLYPLIAGPLMTIKWFTISCAVPVIIFLIFFSIFMPETPHYLVYKNNKHKAEKVLMKLRNKSKEEVSTELLELCKDVESHVSDNDGLRVLFGTPSFRRTIIITGVLLTFQQFSGIPALMSYLESIFSATGSSIPPDVSAAIIGFIQVIVNCAITLFVDKVGRKVLLYISCLGCALSMTFLGFYYFLVSRQYDVSFLWWMPVTCLIVYITMINLGIGPIPWTIMSEIFPTNIKSVASALSSFICSFFGAVVTLAFPLVTEFIGMSASFWIFAGFCLLEIMFIYLVVPETRGKSAEEIQKILKRK